MIRHCVMLRLRPGYDAAELDDVVAGLRAVARRLPGCLGILAGPNRDYEAKSPAFPYGFTLDFENASALAAYASDEQHQSLGSRLTGLCDGGAAGILVYDLEEAGRDAT